MSSPTTFENYMVSQVLRDFKPRHIRPTTNGTDSLLHTKLKPGPSIPTPLVRQQSPKENASFFRPTDTVGGLIFPNSGL